MVGEQGYDLMRGMKLDSYCLKKILSLDEYEYRKSNDGVNMKIDIESSFSKTSDTFVIKITTLHNCLT